MYAEIKLCEEIKLPGCDVLLWTTHEVANIMTVTSIKGAHMGRTNEKYCSYYAIW